MGIVRNVARNGWIAISAPEESASASRALTRHNPSDGGR
jgi:hypothetical protein